MATVSPVVEVVDADGAPVTGDAGNLTLTVITDGVAGAYSGSVTEVAAGQYALSVTVAGTLQSVSGVSSTSGAIVVPARWRNSALAGDSMAATAASMQAGLDAQGYTTAKAALIEAMRGTDGAYTGTPPTVEQIQSGLATLLDLTDAIDEIKGAGWTAETLKAIYDALPSGGTGAFPVTITVEDDEGDPVAGAKVRLQVADGFAVKTTDSNGQATGYNEDAGEWTGYVGTSAAYQPEASYTVTVAADGTVTGATWTVTRASLPVPSDPDCYVLFSDERKVEGDTPFGASGMTVRLVDVEFSGGRVDAAADAISSAFKTALATDANGRWQTEIKQAAFTAGAEVTIRREWTDAEGNPVVEGQRAALAAPGSGTAVSWADLGPRLVEL
jgi:hypothetical protein